MNGEENASRIKQATTRPTFITPSASPPSSRSLSLLRSRISLDRPPPTKRRRLGSTPSSPFSVSTPSSSTVAPFDIHESRKAASERLLNSWATLAERYNRPLHEDDIIDLRDGSIFKDRGVLRGAAKFKFADDDVTSDTNDANSDYGGVHTDDDVDELDAFAPDADISGELELEKEKLLITPVRESDPAYEEDLRAFLEAERLRKEQYGEEEEEEDEVVHLTSVRSSRDSRRISASRIGGEVQTGNHDGTSVETTHKDDEVDFDDMFSPLAATSSTGLTTDENSSDDEFATWDFDTSTPAKRPQPRRPPTPEDVIDLTISPLSSPPHQSRPRGRSRASPTSRSRASSTSSPLQLTRAKNSTRGRSRTPARGITTAKKDAPRANTAIKAKALAPLKAPARRKNSMPPPPLPQLSVNQLATPPPSSSSVIESTPETTADFIPKSSPPSLSPSPPSLPPRPKPRPRYRGALVASSSSTTQSPCVVSGAQSAKLDADTPTPGAAKLKLVPEVIITSRPAPNRGSNAEQRSPAKSHMEVTHNGGEASRKISAKEIDDRLESVAGSTGRGRMRPSMSSHKGAASRTVVIPDVDQQHPDFETLPRPKTRKRKRVLSSSPLSRMSDNEDPFPEITPIVPLRTRSQGRPKNDSGRSTSCRTPKPAHKPTQVVEDDDSDDAGPEPPPPLPPPRARTPHRPPPQTTERHEAPPPLHHMPRYRDSNMPFSYGVGHDHDAQMRFAQAAHYLSYFMNAAASLPPPPGYPPDYLPPFPFPSQAPQRPPWTPVHRSSRSERDRPSSPDAGPSGSSSHNTPSHPHPYPFTFNPSYSGASLPPSSPPASSEPSSPIVRSSSLARGRSKSRGRRVSFKLSDSERPILPSPPHFSDSEEPDDEAIIVTRKTRGHESDTNHRPAARKAKSKLSSSRASTPAVRPDKGKARAGPAEGSDGSDSDRGRKRGRGRTPGPPARRERSASFHAAGRKA